eukprot:TRINITY_DN992_c0_g2_i1.p1 TRINITY_DN992_c0_g2~~TRINITY_DN992_c0_g2_i1.p1  ORF type:complete len:756 (-),score=283.70 TRINITY_DN992_c0_g2_i1:380-2647(-)
MLARSARSLALPLSKALKPSFIAQKPSILSKIGSQFKFSKKGFQRFTKDFEKLTKKPLNGEKPPTPQLPSGGQGSGTEFLISLLLLGTAGMFLHGRNNTSKELSWSEFVEEYVRADNIEKLVVKRKSKVVVVPKNKKDGDETIYFGIGSPDTFERKLDKVQRDLNKKSSEFVPVYYDEAEQSTFMRILPHLILPGVLLFMMTRAPGGKQMNDLFSRGKVSALINPESVKLRFKDVAGVKEAKAEIEEFVGFLKNPKKYSRVGATIPRGALLVGPPGTGKTLLAKACAGEASVPFFSISGSDFIEMFVGVGPSRVRDLFAQARASAPCIVFIDEIDAVARKRNKGSFSGGNDERENTLNQLLVEMDGFKSQEGVVVLAGTNRKDILDTAILRPGRFDRQINLELPDLESRGEIFKVHLAKLKLKHDADLVAERMAALTPGMSGADIANVCNEAAIFAARRNRKKVSLRDFENATDRVVGGLEKRSGFLSPEEKHRVAVHESGHAVTGWFLKYASPLLKVTIIPRASGALGFAQYLPKELHLHSREELEHWICAALGGRVAEELLCGCHTSGAQDDLSKITQIAHQMVTGFGMSDVLGAVSYPNGDPFMSMKPYSEHTGQIIDEEVRRIVTEAEAHTRELLESKKDLLLELAKELEAKETLTEVEIEAILGSRPAGTPDSLRKYVRATVEDSDEEDDGTSSSDYDDSSDSDENENDEQISEHDDDDEEEIEEYEEIDDKGKNNSEESDLYCSKEETK